jgi:hypothetical protein
MSDPERAAARIAEALAAHPLMRMSGVAKVYVIPKPEELVIKTVNEDGSVIQASWKDTSWHPCFLKDEEGFIDRLAQSFPRRLPAPLWDEKGQMDLQYLFIRVMSDLNRISLSADDYDSLRVASLLRPLLMDDQPLIHRVNRIHKLSLSFSVGMVLENRVVDPATLPPSSTPRLVKIKDGRQFFAVGSRFDPRSFDGQPRQMSFDQLLAALVVKVEDHWVSVGQFVSHMAYVEGLVHTGAPTQKRAADVDLHRWRRMLHFNGRAPALETLSAIGRVVSAGAAPLASDCVRALQQGLQLFPSGDEGPGH